MKEILSEALRRAAEVHSLDPQTVKIEFPDEISHGDYSSNVALVNAKKVGKSPLQLAEVLVSELNKNLPKEVQSVSIAGAGFINFKIKDEIFLNQILEIASHPQYGRSKESNEKVMVEYTDPNPFKVFHIGHLMANAIGESVSRLIESSGAKVIRACYQGDVGLHVAKTIWLILKKENEFEEVRGKNAVERVQFLGRMYSEASLKDEDANVQREIAEINKKIFDKSDSNVNNIYEIGRKWSLEYFDQIYKRLNTKFDQFFFESEVAEDGLRIVKDNIGKVFEESEGAIIFKGEKYGLHTRVFITSKGIPTYETKELGLNTEKFKKYPDINKSVIITANEQNDYFTVMLKVLGLINSDIAEKTVHKSHGLLRFASGKMSSRKGNVISAEELIESVRAMVAEKIKDRQFSADEETLISDEIAIGAIKYTILRQSIGSDVIFDSAASVSFEGDSGPYLQYSAVRATSVLKKAEQEGIKPLKNGPMPSQATLLEKLLVRFPDILERARNEFAPQHVAGYLISLAGAFNSFYATQTITDKSNPLSPYYVDLTKAFRTVMENGLDILGIKIPAKM